MLGQARLTVLTLAVNGNEFGRVGICEYHGSEARTGDRLNFLLVNISLNPGLAVVLGGIFLENVVFVEGERVDLSTPVRPRTGNTRWYSPFRSCR